MIAQLVIFADEGKTWPDGGGRFVVRASPRSPETGNVGRWYVLDRLDLHRVIAVYTTETQAQARAAELNAREP